MEERGGGVGGGGHRSHGPLASFWLPHWHSFCRPLEEGGQKGSVPTHQRPFIRFYCLGKKNPPQPFYGPAEVERSSFQERRGRRATLEWRGYLQGERAKPPRTPFLSPIGEEIYCSGAGQVFILSRKQGVISWPVGGRQRPSSQRLVLTRSSCHSRQPPGGNIRDRTLRGEHK